MKRYRVQVTLRHEFDVDAKQESVALDIAAREYDGTTPDITIDILDVEEIEDVEEGPSKNVMDNPDAFMNPGMDFTF